MSLDINEPRYQLALKKLFALRGPYPLSVADEVVPSVVVAGQDPEDFFDKGEGLWFARFSVAALAANLSAGGVRNPAGTQSIVIVERVVLNLAATQLVNVGIPIESAAAGAVASQAFPRDTRLGSILTLATLARSVAQTITNQQAASMLTGFGFTAVQNEVAAANTKEHLGPYVLGPGSQFVVEGGAVNTAVAGTIFWRESPVSADELTR